MEEVQADRSRFLWIAVLIMAVVALAVGAVLLWAGNGQRAEPDNGEGLAAMNRGDYPTAQRYLTQAMNEAGSPQDRAGYEVLLATSMEGSAPEDAAHNYLNVIDDVSLSQQIRTAASVYLLMFLNARQDASFTKAVFANSPWSGLYQPLKPDESINAEIAITKAHETIIAADPNFLSYLIAGEFYARKYPYLTGGIARFRDEYRSKATEYFGKGMALLRTARDANEWDKTRLALGYTYAVAYAVELDEAGLGSLTDVSMRATYLEAAGFADDNSRGEALMESARFTIRLAYARYLATHQTPQNATMAVAIGNELIDLVREPQNKPLFKLITNSADLSSKYGRLNAGLLYLASSSPALGKVVAGGMVQ